MADNPDQASEQGFQDDADQEVPCTPPRAQQGTPSTPRTPPEAAHPHRGKGKGKSREGKSKTKSKTAAGLTAFSKHLQIWIPFPPQHLGEASPVQHLQWAAHIWRFRKRWGYELMGHIDEPSMQRYSRVPIATVPGQTSAREPRAQRKRGRSISPTQEERELTGPSAASYPMGAPPPQAMLEAQSSAVRKEQQSHRRKSSNRPKSPAKRPPRNDTGASGAAIPQAAPPSGPAGGYPTEYSPFDQGPSRAAPTKPSTICACSGEKSAETSQHVGD
eukprot:5362239-Amphidinium_carterae.1